MAKVIIHTNENGGVTVTYPSPEYLETNTIEDLLIKDCPNHAFIVDDFTLPQSENGDFFNSWEIDAQGNVAVNLSKAKEQTKERLRAEREPLLTAQDVAFQRALESGADTTAIVAEKQRLRDITALTDTATTLEELRSLKAGV
jgi:hypothetical protein